MQRANIISFKNIIKKFIIKKDKCMACGRVFRYTGETDNNFYNFDIGKFYFYMCLHCLEEIDRDFE